MRQDFKQTRTGTCARARVHARARNWACTTMGIKKVRLLCLEDLFAGTYD